MVCRSVWVCLSVHSHLKNDLKFSVHVTCGRGSVLVGQQCKMQYVMYFRFCGGHVFTRWVKQIQALSLQRVTVTRQLTPLDCASGGSEVRCRRLPCLFLVLLLCKAGYTLPCPRAVYTGRVHGCHFFDTRVHGLWTWVVCTELYGTVRETRLATRQLYGVR